MVIPPEEAERDATGFLKSKYEEQQRNLELIRKPSLQTYWRW